jgi:hypothetical protein
VFFRSPPAKVNDTFLDIALLCGAGHGHDFEQLRVAEHLLLHVIAAKAGDAHVRYRLNGIVQPFLKERRCAEVAGQKNSKVLASAIGQFYEAQRPTFAHGEDVFSSLVPPEDYVACTRVVTALQNSISIFRTGATLAPHERAAKGCHPREAFAAPKCLCLSLHRRVPFQTRSSRAQSHRPIPWRLVP